MDGLTAAGFVVERAATCPDSYAMGRDQAFGAIVMDLGLPGMEGIDALKRWRAWV